MKQSLRKLAAAAGTSSTWRRRSSFDQTGSLLVGVSASARRRAGWLDDVAIDWQRDGDAGTPDHAGRKRRLTRWDGRQLIKELRRCRTEGSLESLHKLFLTDSQQASRPAAILINQIDQAAAREDNQFLLCQLIDGILRSPTLLAVTLPRHPAVLPLHPLLESRLTGGLVLPLGEAVHREPLAGQRKPPKASQTPQKPTKPPTPRRIIAAVARYYRLSPAELLGASQRRSHVRPRGLAIHCLRQLTGLSSHAIGGICGGRDHATVLHSLKVTTRLLQTDPGLAGDLETILENLGSRSADLSASC